MKHNKKDKYFGCAGLASFVVLVSCVLIGCSTGNEDNVSATSISTPVSFVVTGVSGNMIGLSWSPPADDGLVTGYKIFRDGTYIQSTNSTSFIDTNLQL